MKVDVTRKLMTLSGEPIPVPGTPPCEACGRPQANGQDMLLRDAITDALMGTYNDEEGVDGKVKFERYQLALKVQGEDEPELTIQDAALVQDLVARMYAPLVCGQVWLMLEAVKEKADQV